MQYFSTVVILGIFFLSSVICKSVSYRNFCKTYEFRCTNGQCIEEDLLCDGKPDCTDQSDETSDVCSTTHCPTFAYTCKYGACISLLHRCNGITNCADNSDETNCPQHGLIKVEHAFTSVVQHTLMNHKVQKYLCHSGEAINNELICDGNPDCFDQSDETPSLCSDLYCPYFTFRCSYGACIKLSDKCNGINNCVDGSDEKLCSTSSTMKPETQTTISPSAGKEFQCDSGEIIDEEFLCDGEPDCADQSDETAKKCSQLHCPSFSFRCNYGACVLAGARCNGVKECADNSDETVCSVPIETSTVLLKEFKCNSGQVIDADLVCDGKADCIDVSDENSTICSEINCPHFAHRCNYGACVHGTARCNGLTECIDNSDEAFCPTTIKPITKDQILYKDYLTFS